MAWTKSQADKLGARLRETTSADAHAGDRFEDYRRAHVPSLNEVLGSLPRPVLQFYPPVARLKTLESVVGKLRRQPIRLSQMQDIAGFRVVVPDLRRQEAAIAQLQAVYECRVVDYRDNAQCGYRAVHVIVATAAGFPVEGQVRTTLQDAWANVSEALSGQFGLEVKYCGGPERVRLMLDRLSGLGHRIERAWRETVRIGAAAADAASHHATSTRSDIADLRRSGSGSMEDLEEDLALKLDSIEREIAEFVSMTSEFVRQIK